MRTTGLKIIRQEMNATQKQMMELLELNTPSHYTMIENGQRGVSVNLLAKIAEVSDKSIKEVYSILKSHEVTTSAMTRKNNLNLTERQTSTGNRRKNHGIQSASAQ